MCLMVRDDQVKKGLGIKPLLSTRYLQNNVFPMAGETYEARDPLIMIPKDIRNMAVRILDQCVSDQELGGEK